MDDVRVTELRPLIPPAILIEELPVTPAIAATVRSAREQASRIVRRKPDNFDDRLLVVVGPCSIHDPSAAIEYGTFFSLSLASLLRPETKEACCGTVVMGPRVG